MAVTMNAFLVGVYDRSDVVAGRLLPVVGGDNMILYFVPSSATLSICSCIGREREEFGDDVDDEDQYDRYLRYVNLSTLFVEASRNIVVSLDQISDYRMVISSVKAL